MTIPELRELERRLEEAENLFMDSRNYSPESQAFWEGLRELLTQVTTHRMRLEERRPATERNPTV